MAYTQTFVTATAVTTGNINSTKVTVVSNVACFVGINATATSATNFPMVAANRPTSINMLGRGNTLSLLPSAGTAAISVTHIGNVAVSGTVV